MYTNIPDGEEGKQIKDTSLLILIFLFQGKQF